MNLELKKAIDQISKDKGLERDMLIDTLEDAVRTSVIRKYGEDLAAYTFYFDMAQLATWDRAILEAEHIPATGTRLRSPPTAFRACPDAQTKSSPHRFCLLSVPSALCYNDHRPTAHFPPLACCFPKPS